MVQLCLCGSTLSTRFNYFSLFIKSGLRRIKEEAEENIKSLKASIHEIHYENSSKAESSNIELVQRNNELKEITTMHDKYIQGMTSNLDKISLENRDAVSNLLDNLEMAKQENYAIIEKQNKAIEELRKCQEAAFEDFKRELEKVKDLNEMVQSDAKDREDARLENSNQITTKLEIQDNAIKRLEERLESVSHNAVEKHNSMNKTHSQSMSDLREEFISQMIVNKEVSITVQEEFNEKLEEINQSLSKKTASNQAKIQEIKEVLDGISVNIEQKLGNYLNNIYFYVGLGFVPGERSFFHENKRNDQERSDRSEKRTNS